MQQPTEVHTQAQAQAEVLPQYRHQPSEETSRLLQRFLSSAPNRVVALLQTLQVVEAKNDELRRQRVQLGRDKIWVKHELEKAKEY